MEKINYFYEFDGSNCSASIVKMEGEYYCHNYPVANMEYYYDEKIGAIDFETYGSERFGNQNVYAGGWTTKDKSEMFYIEEGEEPDSLVNRTIESILKDNELNGYTFYAHNLGRFEYVFLLNTLCNEDYNIKAIWNETSIIKLKISDNNSKQTAKPLYY